MGWNKDGSTVKARYLGEYECTGTVTESRVSYGGRVLYTLELDTLQPDTGNLGGKIVM